VPGILWDVPTGIPYFIFQERSLRIRDVPTGIPYFIFQESSISIRDVPTGILYFIFQESCIRIGMSQLALHTLFFKKAV